MPHFHVPRRPVVSSDEDGGGCEKVGHPLHQRPHVLDAPPVGDRPPHTACELHDFLRGTQHCARQARGSEASGALDLVPADHRPGDVTVALDIAEDTLATGR